MVGVWRLFLWAWSKLQTSIHTYKYIHIAVIECLLHYYYYYYYQYNTNSSCYLRKFHFKSNKLEIAHLHSSYRSIKHYIFSIQNRQPVVAGAKLFTDRFVSNFDKVSDKTWILMNIFQTFSLLLIIWLQVSWWISLCYYQCWETVTIVSPSELDWLWNSCKNLNQDLPDWYFKM